MENEKTVSEDRLRSTGVLTVCNSLRLLSFTYGKKQLSSTHRSNRVPSSSSSTSGLTQRTLTTTVSFESQSIVFFCFWFFRFLNFLGFVRKMKLVYSQFSSARKYTMSYRTLSYGACVCVCVWTLETGSTRRDEALKALRTKCRRRREVEYGEGFGWRI